MFLMIHLDSSAAFETMRDSILPDRLSDMGLGITILGQLQSFLE